MEIRRLGWAGVELRTENGSAVIDLVQRLGFMSQLVGELHGPLPAPSVAGGAQVALLTHLHEDHADAAALADALAPDGVVLRPPPASGPQLDVVATAAAEAALAEHGIVGRVVQAWETVELAGLRMTAVPAVDGFGDPQVSWVVEGGGMRVLHAGDTLFHGWWWSIRDRLGPIDVAFLPINGPAVSLPHRQPPSPLEAGLGPRSAAAAASILRAGLVVPIHYDAIKHPPAYIQAEDPVGAFTREAAALDVAVRVLAPGETL